MIRIFGNKTMSNEAAREMEVEVEEDGDGDVAQSKPDTVGKHLHFDRRG